MHEISQFMIGAITGTAIGFVVTAYLNNQKKKDVQLERLEVFRSRRDDVLRDIVFKTSSVNAIIFKIHNGGGKLDESSPWYSSVVAEAPAHADVSIIDFWQNKHVDEGYRELIRVIRRNKMHWIHEGGIESPDLVRLYARTRILGSCMVELYADEYFYYYASFPIREDFQKMLENANVNQYEVAQVHLQRLYMKYDHLGILPLDWTFPKSLLH